MKKTIRSLLVSLPIILVAAPSFAGFQMRIPMEVANGGAMSNGSIVFADRSDTTSPVEPTVPEVVDPFEPENPDCDPYAVGYPGNSTGKELVWGVWYVDKTAGYEYRPCKLKEVKKPKLLARFAYQFLSKFDQCDPNLAGSKAATGAAACSVSGLNFQANYKITKDALGNNSYTTLPLQFTIPSQAGYGMEEVDKFMFDGFTCSNLRNELNWKGETIGTICDFQMSYNDLKGMLNKQFIVEVYGK